MIKLIITADDFGYSRLFNEMILELIEGKAVTSTSVMIDEIDSGQKEQVEKLIQLSKNHLACVGLHIYFKNTNFREEVERQFGKFVEVFGFKPSHIDIHKTDYLKEGYPVIQEFCKRRKIPCKNLSLFGEDIMNTDGLITTQDSIFNGTGKSFSEIKEWLGSLQDGFYVINFHPGYYDPESKSRLNKEREMDAENIRKIITSLREYDIELVNFYDLAASF
ncbi:ChbG/HpnK family deacetylase [Patescibacteria group bacterium]|nr:ChbG/HpnK family deacetylase [Patescibacteria group bacterium]